MGVVERVRNLLACDLEEMRSRSSAPARIRRYLRELEWTHRELVAAARHAEVTREYLEKKVRENAGRSEQWAERAELALHHENEPLARIALAKRQTRLAESAQLTRELQDCINQQKELAEQLSHLEERILATRYLRSTSFSGAPDVSGRAPLLREVERELEALKKRLSGST